MCHRDDFLGRCFCYHFFLNRCCCFVCLFFGRSPMLLYSRCDCVWAVNTILLFSVQRLSGVGRSEAHEELKRYYIIFFLKLQRRQEQIWSKQKGNQFMDGVCLDRCTICRPNMWARTSRTNDKEITNKVLHTHTPCARRLHGTGKFTNEKLLYIFILCLKW